MKRPGHIPKTCAVCNQAFRASRPSQTACSRRCRDRAKRRWRTLILERDSHTCGLCKPWRGRDAEKMRPTFLDVIRVNPTRAGTAGNLVTACRSCARGFVGRLPKAVEAAVLEENVALCQGFGLDPAALVEGKSWEELTTRARQAALNEEGEG